MKKHKFLLLLACSCSLFAAAQKNKLLLSLSYNNVNNHLQYLEAHAKSKVDGKLKLVQGLTLTFYLGDHSAQHRLGSSVTNEEGAAYCQVPASAKEMWNGSPKPSLLVEAAETGQYEAGSANFELTHARLWIDTGADKKIIATLREKRDSGWFPVKGVDIKVAVRRQGGDLNVNETQSFSTDSIGQVIADFKRDSLPGDTTGQLLLVAKVEDHDAYGNLSVEKAVPWGVHIKFVSLYDRRTLYARRGKSPVWLEIIAYSIIVGVWGILIFVVLQIRKLKLLGQMNDGVNPEKTT